MSAPNKGSVATEASREAITEKQEWKLGFLDDNYTVITETCEVVIGFGSIARLRAQVLIDSHNNNIPNGLPSTPPTTPH